MRKITYEQVISGKRFDDYSKEAEYILNLIEKGRIKPVMKSPQNGKRPALHTRYWLLDEKKDYSELIEELRNNITPFIDIDYYLKHPEVYEKERRYVIALSDYIDRHKEELAVEISENERSFEIWQREKILSGKSYDGVSAGDVLKHCGIDRDYLRTYRTAEPIAYYSHRKETPQNILILENLDPFYSIRRLMLQGGTVCGGNYGTLVYGGGKRVIRAFDDFDISAEPYMKEDGNHFFYAGDLDYEGIAIYEGLARRMNRELLPCMELYNRMLDKAHDIERLPLMKNQNTIDIIRFAYFFSTERREKLQRVLESGRYIPQEILSVWDYDGRTGQQ